jgi:hypothetical protein
MRWKRTDRRAGRRRRAGRGQPVLLFRLVTFAASALFASVVSFGSSR